jgi:hypothetical protein
MRPIPAISSALPRFIIPCPHCGGRMIITSIVTKSFDPECEDITHGCTTCGGELSRLFGPVAPALSDLRAN